MEGRVRRRIEIKYQYANDEMRIEKKSQKIFKIWIVHMLFSVLYDEKTN